MLHLNPFTLSYREIVSFRGPVPTNDTQTPPLRRGHLDIKDAQCAENEDGRKISYRVWAVRATKRDVFGAQKFIFVSKLRGQICRVDWN